MKKFLFFLFFSTLLFSDKSHILYLMQKEKYSDAISSYQKFYKKNKTHDPHVLQNMCLTLLKKGIESSDRKKRHMSMFGAGFAISEYSASILEKGLLKKDLESQMIALHFIQNLEDDHSIKLLLQACKSPFLQARLQAIFILAQKRDKNAVCQIKTLLQKLPMIKPIFVPLLGIMTDKEATSLLKTMLFDTNPHVRLQAIFTIANNKRDDLLYLLKKIQHSSSFETEAILYALGALQDSSSVKYIKKYQNSSSKDIQLASYLASYKLKDNKALEKIKEFAKQGSFLAISSLGKIGEKDPLFYKLLSHKNNQIKYNATIALLLCKDPKCLKPLKELLKKDICIKPIYSQGKSMQAWNFSPGEDSFRVKEYFLSLAKELPKKDFLELATFICNQNIKKLIPHLFEILSDLKEEAFLKEQSQKIGAPYIRSYANLFLYKTQKNPIHLNNLKEWIKKNNKEIILFGKFSSKTSTYVISKEEVSRLLLDSFIVLSDSHTTDGIDILLKAMSHPKNRFLLAGILLKALE